MKYIVFLFPLIIVTALYSDVTVNTQMIYNDEQVWALRMDYRDWVEAGRQTNGVSTNTLTLIQWYQRNASNQLWNAAQRRLKIRKDETQAIISERWPSLTPEQMTNVMNALPQ